jgi:O-antigen ligase
VGLLAVALLAVGAIGYLGRKSIAERGHQSLEQLSHLTDGGTLDSRLTLYRDTWHMAEAKPWFGWGLESYAHAFRLFNSHRANEGWVWISFYAEAHNDWLQSLAEVGFIGTGLLVLLGVLPLAAVRWPRVSSPIPRYLLAGCGLLLLYAWMEFPFANPAVLLTFCAIFYCAARYAELDAAQARPHE